MAKKIKFPLEMSNGIQVRTLEDLQKNFDLEKILGYFLDGKLITWLNDRYYEDKATQISKLDSSSPKFKQELCEVLEVEYAEQDIVDLEEIKHKNYRLNKLKQFTDDVEFITNIDKIAFNQEELSDLIHCSTSIIYLCGEKFTIPLSKENTTYIGINNPVVFIKSKMLIDFNSKHILLKNVRFNDEYNKIILEKKETTASKNIYKKNYYKTSTLLDFMMKNTDRESSENLFDIIQNELGNIHFDIDKLTESKYEILTKSNLSEVFEKYLDNIC